MHKHGKMILVLLLLPILTGCAGQKAAYVATGSLIGAGGGYAIENDGKDTAIGGLIGGLTGAVLADVHQNKMKRQYEKAYSQGFTQAQLEIAIDNWDINTGKKEDEIYSKSYQRIKVPKKEINNVVYESHYETLEVYQ